MAFRVGQKVVCVDDKSPPIRGWRNDPDWPVKGRVYTIAALRTDPYSGLPALQTTECRDSVWYQTNRFRPVVERKTETGMAILREILERESHQDRVPVKTP